MEPSIGDSVRLCSCTERNQMEKSQSGYSRDGSMEVLWTVEYSGTLGCAVREQLGYFRSQSVGKIGVGK